MSQETVSLLEEAPVAEPASAGGHRDLAASKLADTTSLHSQTAVPTGDAGPPLPSDASDASAQPGLPEEQPMSRSPAENDSDLAHVSSSLSNSTIAARGLASAAAPDMRVCFSAASAAGF